MFQSRIRPRLCQVVKRLHPKVETNFPYFRFHDRQLCMMDKTDTYNNLKQNDPTLYNLLRKEDKRQHVGLNMIASENFTSEEVMECLGSVLTNKYSEGLPGKRYYGGNQYIDEIENLCKQRALEAYRLDPGVWDVNVQPYSGSIANLAAYTGLLNPHDRLMGLNLPSGGHLSHGFFTNKKKISATSVFWESLPYHVNETGYIDYDRLEKDAKNFLPKLIVSGASVYPRDYDFGRFRDIANKVDAYLMCDMAHVSGLVATEEHSSPFEYCDVVTTTTHKTLRGPRAGMIFFKKELEDKINFAVFPGVQGGPHNNQIAAIATQLREVMTPEFKQYIQQVKSNAKRLGEQLQKYGYKLATDGTDNHLLLVNLHSNGVTGSKVEKLCEKVGIYINKNCVHGDTSPMTPGGIRLGTPCLTTMGFKEDEMDIVAEFLHRSICLSIEIQDSGNRLLSAFASALDNHPEVLKLKEEIKDWSKTWSKNLV